MNVHMASYVKQSSQCFLLISTYLGVDLKKLVCATRFTPLKGVWISAKWTLTQSGEAEKTLLLVNL